MEEPCIIAASTPRWRSGALHGGTLIVLCHVETRAANRAVRTHTTAPESEYDNAPRSTLPGEYRRQIWRANGTLEPAFERWQVGLTDSLAQRGLDCAEPLRQKTNERLGFPSSESLGFPSREALGFPFSAPFSLPVSSQFGEIARYVALHHQ